MLFNLCFSVNYCFQASCKDLHWKTNFSLPFYAESWKMRKIPFLVTKSGQILNLMSGKVPRPQICGGFHLSESSSDGRNIPLEGGGQKRPFLPPPQLDSCQFEGLCLRTLLLTIAAKVVFWVGYTFLQKPSSFKFLSILEEKCVAHINIATIKF